MPFVEGVPTVTVVLDKPRRIGFTTAAMRRMHKPMADLGLEMGIDEEGALLGGLLAIPVFIWACLEDRDLSLEQVEEMIHPVNALAMAEAMKLLTKLSSPTKKEGEDVDQTGDPTQAGPKLATG